MNFLETWRINFSWTKNWQWILFVFSNPFFCEKIINKLTTYLLNKLITFSTHSHLISAKGLPFLFLLVRFNYKSRNLRGVLLMYLHGYDSSCENNHVLWCNNITWNSFSFRIINESKRANIRGVNSSRYFPIYLKIHKRERYSFSENSRRKVTRRHLWKK